MASWLSGPGSIWGVGKQAQSKMSGSRRAAWAKEFDRRKAAGKRAYHQRVMKGELQIVDDRGNHYWRNGNACCGCGRHNAAADHGLANAYAGPVF